MNQNELGYNQKYYPSLNGLRGISIIMVLFDHIFLKNRNILINTLSGALGVNIFFVISGFLITTLLLKEYHKTGSISIKNFFIRRALRILPVAYLYCLVLAFLNFIFHLNIGYKSFLGALLYFRNLTFSSFNDWQTAHFWSLSVEEQFYLIFPLIFFKSRNLFFTAVFSLVFIIPVTNYLFSIKYLFSDSEQVKLSLKIMTDITPILAGSLAAFILFKSRDLLPLMIVNSSLYNIFLFSLAAIIHTFRLTFIADSFVPLLTSLLICLLIINNLVKCDNFFFAFLNTPAMAYIGILSYSIYIWQQIFLHDMPWAHLFRFSDSISLNIILLLIVSWSSFNLFEKRFLALKTKF